MRGVDAMPPVIKLNSEDSDDREEIDICACDLSLISRFLEALKLHVSVFRWTVPITEDAHRVFNI